MSVYPHSRILIGPSKTISITGPHIQILETSTGTILHTTSNEQHEQHAGAKNSGPVLCAAVDREFRYLLTSGEDKLLKLWEVEGLKLLSERELPKRPTSVTFTADAQTLLVSDKFGDVFSYPFTYVPLTTKQKKDALSSHENPSGGQLVLGHASPLNAFLLTPDEKYIITADRDEHIRVSWYPKGYNIEMYCLGHHKFVSAIHIPHTDPTSLISGGGDPMLKIWDWMKGTIKHELPILEAVEPFIAVRAVRRRRGWSEEDGEEAPEGGERGRRRKGRGKGKGKKNEEEGGDGEEVEGEGEAEGEQENAGTPAPSEGQTQEPEEQRKPEKVLVVRRIESVESNTGTHVLFSAVGTTALFSFPYKLDVSPSEIRHFDFKKPVIDFSLAQDNTVVVTLDGRWTPPEGSDSSASLEESMVKVLRIVDGAFVEDATVLQPLISSLNSSALLPATPEDIKKLDLYGDLTAMPKYSSDASSEQAEPLPIGAPQLSASETVKSTKGKGKAELSKKELGRIKNKQKVLEKAQEKTRKASEPAGSEEPEAKRARSEATSEHESKDDDVVMAGA